MTARDKTAYCGIYCPDCILYRNDFSPVAAQLQSRLSQAEFDKYATIDSPFGTDLTTYPAFEQMLGKLVDAQCDKPCRVGGGCSGKPCAIMECCLSQEFEGCWECDDVDACDKFHFLQPRCGNIPKENIKSIRAVGIEKWEKERGSFYIWQK